jgi:SAM-dependent methyltransferase
VLLFGPLYHLTEAADRRQALGEARRVLAPGGRLLAMAVCRFAWLLDGLYEGWLDDPDFRPIVDQDLADGQHRNPDPVGRPAGVLHHRLLPHPRRREQILFAARTVETQPSLIGFSDHLIAAAIKP